jgi:hypothetical protein
VNKLLISATLAVGLIAGSASAGEMEDLVAEGKGLVQQFGGALKTELLAAVEAGGPVNAINVCNLQAPAMATSMSEASGWSIGRSSHLLRNPANAPDEFTATAIEEFLARQVAGESAADLAKAAIVEENGQRVFRLVKAIPTGGLCLNCHGGDNVKPIIVDRLAELYPEDMARGFSEGEMRGVFTLSKQLD